jgi:hypothetical protein
MYSVRRSLNAACACRLRCLRSSAVEWTCTCQCGTLCADLVIPTGFFTPLPAKRSAVRAYVMSLAFKKFIDSNWISPALRLDLDTRSAESSRLLNRKRCPKRVLYIPNQQEVSSESNSSPRIFWKGKVWRGWKIVEEAMREEWG